MILIPNIKVVIMKESGKNLQLKLVLGMESVSIKCQLFQKGVGRVVATGFGRCADYEVDSDVGDEVGEVVEL